MCGCCVCNILLAVFVSFLYMLKIFTIAIVRWKLHEMCPIEVRVFFFSKSQPDGYKLFLKHYKYHLTHIHILHWAYCIIIKPQKQEPFRNCNRKTAIKAHMFSYQIASKSLWFVCSFSALIQYSHPISRSTWAFKQNSSSVSITPL